MRKIVAAFMLMSFTAFADVVEVKEGILTNADDVTTDVKGGVWFDDASFENLKNVFGQIVTQNDELSQKLVSANKKIVECTAFVPGLPAWAYVAISVGLSGLTLLAGFFALKDVK